MEDWVHCNKCSLRLQPNIKWYIGECSHIVCEKCWERGGSACVVCEKPKTFIQITENLDTNIQQFFIPVDVLMKKSLEVYNFQMQNRKKLFYNLYQKYNFAKKECVNCINRNKLIMCENRMLKNMLNMQPGSAPRPYATSTPTQGRGRGQQMDNVSEISSIPFTPNINCSVKRPIPGYAQRMPSADRGHNRMFQNYPSNVYHGNLFPKPSPAQTVPSVHRNMGQTPDCRFVGTDMSMKELKAMGSQRT